MTVLKGYPGQRKEERTSNQYTTVNPLSEQIFGLDVRAHSYVQSIGTDAAEADSTTSVINATAHAALVGDVIYITSGALSGLQSVVISKTANTITVGTTFDSAIATAVTFTIYRFRLPVVDASGNIGTSTTVTPTPTLFTLNGSDQEVTEDTGTPANNRPLPVKLVNALGDIAPATEGTLSTLNGKVTACNTGAVVVSSSALPSGAATEATLAAQSAKITACNTGAVVVSSSALPSGASTEATLSTLDGKVTACNTGAVVVSSSALPSGAATEATLAALSAKLTERDVVDFMDVPLLIASTTNIPASASVPVTVVASLAADVKKLQFMDTTGAYIGVYSDPAGTPVLECILGPGSDSTVECQLPSATVIGLRNMENSAIAAGSLAINFIG